MSTLEVFEGGSINPKPEVSIIVPAYKVAPFIDETLSSIFSQSFTDFEVIVINDGSPDTPELENAIEKYRPSIRYLKQANQGAGAARNAGLRIARGQFVAFLDGDDVWLPEFLSDQLKLINSNGGYDLVYADAINFGNPIFAGRNSMKTNPSLGDVTFEKLLCGECNVITSAVVARRQRIIDVGLFDVQFPNSQDFDLWLRLAKDNSRITYQRKILVKRRLYAGSLAADSVKSFEGEIRVLEKAARRDDITLSQRELIALTIASRRSSAEVLKGKRALLNGEFDQAERAFALAYSSQHNWKVRLVLFSLRLSPRVTQHMFKFQESRTGNFASSSIQPTSAQG